MKRGYQKGRRSEAQKRAMELYLEIRAKIRKDNPGLLSSIRERLLAQQNPQQIKIDRQKNLQTINKVMDLPNHSTEFQAKLRKLISSVNM